RRAARKNSGVGDVEVLELVAAALLVDHAVLRSPRHPGGAEGVVGRGDHVARRELAGAEDLGLGLGLEQLGHPVEAGEDPDRARRPADVREHAEPALDERHVVWWKLNERSGSQPDLRAFTAPRECSAAMITSNGAM